MSSTPEPEWDDTQQGWMLGLAEYRASLCVRCGQPLDATTDPAHNSDDPTATHAYQVPDPKTCFLCEAFARKEKQIEALPNLGVNPTSFHYAAHLVPRTARGG